MSARDRARLAAAIAAGDVATAIALVIEQCAEAARDGLDRATDGLGPRGGEQLVRPIRESVADAVAAVHGEIRPLTAAARAEDPLSAILDVPGAQDLTEEQTMVCKLAQVKGAQTRLEGWEKDLKQRLYDHYRETGERPGVPNGPCLEVRTRTSWLYDTERIREAMPEVWRLAAEISHSRVERLVKAGVLSEADIEPYRVSDSKEYVQVGRSK